MLRRKIRILLLLPLFFLAACTSAPRYTTKPVKPKPEPAKPALSSMGDDVVKLAKSYVGTPYRSGGTNKAGVDCSGLVFSVYKKIGLALPRTSHGQATFGKEIDRSQLRPGDLVFFRTAGGAGVSHVGIYSGRGRFIHASTRSRQVRIDALDDKYFRKRFIVARRVL